MRAKRHDWANRRCWRFSNCLKWTGNGSPAPSGSSAKLCDVDVVKLPVMCANRDFEGNALTDVRWKKTESSETRAQRRFELPVHYLETFDFVKRLVITQQRDAML